MVSATHVNITAPIILIPRVLDLVGYRIMTTPKEYTLDWLLWNRAFDLINTHHYETSPLATVENLIHHIETDPDHELFQQTLYPNVSLRRSQI